MLAIPRQCRRPFITSAIHAGAEIFHGTEYAVAQARYPIEVVAPDAAGAVGEEIQPSAIRTEERIEVVGTGVDRQRPGVTPSTIHPDGLPQVPTACPTRSISGAPDDLPAIGTDACADLGLWRGDHPEALDAEFGRGLCTQWQH